VENEDPTKRLYIAQKIPWIDTIDEDLCLGKSRVGTFGLVPIYQASELDDRWFYLLHAHRDVKMASPREMREAVYAEKVRRVRQLSEDWAKEVGYWHFRKSFDGLNLSSVKAENPADYAHKRRDELGRDFK